MDKNTGLQNIGNTCYLNSALQLLIKCSVFTKFFIINKFYHSKLNNYKHFLESYSSFNVCNPNNIKIITAQKNIIFHGSDQNDSHEFLITLLDIFENAFIEEFNYIKNKKLGGAVINNSIEIKDFMSKIFDIKLGNITICTNCNHNTMNTVNEKILSLPIKDLNNSSNNQTNYTLGDIFDDFVEDEKLDNDNKWVCDKCHQIVNANKKITILNTPKYFILQLKRFNHGINATKINTLVDIPIELSINDANYKLRSFIVHSGGLNGGHYVSFGLNNNEWFLYNDNAVSLINDINYLNQQLRSAYILLYVKLK